MSIVLKADVFHDSRSIGCRQGIKRVGGGGIMRTKGAAKGVYALPSVCLQIVGPIDGPGGSIPTSLGTFTWTLGVEMDGFESL